MSKTIDDGGLAFPGKRVQQVGRVSDFGFTDDDSPTFGDVDHPGMSLRDWFAGQALAGICANSAWNDSFHPSVNAPSAKAAYAMADSMISARSALSLSNGGKGE